MADKYDLFASTFGRFLLRELPQLPRGERGRERVKNVADAILKLVGAKPNSYDNFEHLGRGGYADVFWCKNDRKKVLKLTRDDDDAKSCAILQTNPDKSLLKVYKVAEVPHTHWWVILVEKLTPLSGSQDKKWHKADEAFKYLRSNIKNMGMDDYWLSDLLEEIERAEKSDNVNSHKAAKAAQAVLPVMEVWVEKLTERGITWRDFHRGNIMMRGRLPIISDLGVSWVRGSPHIPVLAVDYKNT